MVRGQTDCGGSLFFSPDYCVLLMVSHCLLQFSGGASAVNQIAETPTQVEKVEAVLKSPAERLG